MAKTLETESPGVFCLACDYPYLVCGAGACAECGRAINPDDPNTYQADRPLSLPGKFWAKPIGLPAFGVLSLVSGVMLWCGTSPRFYYLVDLIVLFYFSLLVLGFLVVRCACPTRVHAYRIRCYPHFRFRAASFAGVAAGVVLVLACRVPLKLAFLVSKPGFDQLVAQVGPDLEPQMTADVQCGLYRVSATLTNRRYGGWGYHERGRIVFMIEDELGFIYSPGGIEGLAYNSGSCGWLVGNWYWMAED